MMMWPKSSARRGCAKSHFGNSNLFSLFKILQTVWPPFEAVSSLEGHGKLPNRINKYPFTIVPFRKSCGCFEAKVLF